MTTTSRRAYNKIHQWLRRNHGVAQKCVAPDCEHESNRFEWALQVGKKHQKDVVCYIQLCQTCHRKYDKKHGLVGLVHENETRPRPLGKEYPISFLVRLQPKHKNLIKMYAKKWKVSEAGAIRLSIEYVRTHNDVIRGKYY